MTPEQKAAALQPLIERVRTSATATRNAAGRQGWTDVPLTAARLLMHLDGSGPARGVCPIGEGESTVRVAVLDFDDHAKDMDWSTMSAAVQRVAAALEFAWGAQPIAWRSGGGRGVHLFILWREAQDAYSVMTWLDHVLADCKFREGVGGVRAGRVEAFPKQDHVKPGKYGNQFILPWSRSSVPLVYEELSGLYLARDEFAAADWLLSEPVQFVEKPVHAPRAPVDLSQGASWRQALHALMTVPKAVAALAARGPWLECLMAIHQIHEGDEIGRDVAHEFSAALPQYEPERVDKDWNSFRVRNDGVTFATILHHARQLAGWAEEINADEFGPVDERGESDDLTGMGLVALPSGAVVPREETAEAVERRGVPRAQHLCTDQANANRLVRHYGNKLLVSAGSWYVWDGKRWARDEGEVYRFACQLGRLVKDEARKVREEAARSGPDAAALKVAEAIAVALEKWSTKSEMKGAIEAALGLARKMLTVESDSLDRSPWLLNCANGTVDLRTGVLGSHRIEDRITKLVSVDYKPGAWSAAWAKMLDDVCMADGALVGFLRRWLGYCCTGSTREQKFAVLWGGGGNGKSVMLGAVEEVLGEYSATAATELVVAKGGGSGTHSSAVAALVGRRMVTAHESGESGTLAEAFIKKATGSDKMDARYLYGEQFSFAPTHKIQLLTNYKPTIKGQDKGIWRRVLLVPFVARFGTADDVAAGRATHLRDMLVSATLARREEKEGILADLVRGAVEWFTGGLAEPEVVRAAGEEYQAEQDRIGQFVSECCEIGVTLSEPLTGAMGGGLYPTYQGWCKEGGILPVSKQRFVRDLERVVPVFRVIPTLEGGRGARRKIQKVCGIRILPDVD
jgi:P4 family phage/plasmid primase-like protien